MKEANHKRLHIARFPFSKVFRTGNRKWTGGCLGLEEMGEQGIMAKGFFQGHGKYSKIDCGDGYITL